MEFEQIVKRLDWLDEEHRKEKLSLEELTGRLTALEGEIKVLTRKVKELGSQSAKLASAAARMEQFDSALARQRTEMVKYADDLETRHRENQAEVDKRYQIQFDGVNKSISDFKKVRDGLAEIRRELKARADEETRRGKLRAEWETRLQALLQNAEQFERNLKAADDSHRQDSKRLASLQGEISALRKRLEETREKGDLTGDGVRRVEARLNEVLTSEAERRQSQTSFIETQARLQVERDRAWKEWEDNLGALRKQTESMDRHLQEWDSVQRAVKRAQETYEDLVEKFERRINEITEMQRLAEDRFRQEWVSFKADDQKRWTSYTLSQDENHKDTRGEVGKLSGRLSAVEDLTQTQQDMIQQTKEANEQLLQGLLAQIHELLSAYERILGTK